MRRTLLSAVLATVWICFLSCAVDAQQTRGMQLNPSASIPSPGSTGYAFSTYDSNSKALIAADERLYSVNLDTPSSITLLFTEPEGDQIVGAYYDATNGSSDQCVNSKSDSLPRLDRRPLLAATGSIWIATPFQVALAKDIYSQYSSNDNSWLLSTNVGGTVSELTSVVVLGSKVFWGGASGSIFTSATSNQALSSGSIDRFTRGVGQVVSMAVSAARNRVYIGGDQGVLTEINAATMAFTRISFTDNVSLLSIQIDDLRDVMFVNAQTKQTPVSTILRINLNDENFDTFGSLPLGVPVNTGIVDPRPGKFTLLYVNEAGDTVYPIRSGACSDYNCGNCNSDTNFCGYCSTSRTCVLSSTTCPAGNFFTTNYVCPELTSINPASGSTDGGTTVVVTGQFTDPAGNTLTSGVECQWGSGSRVGATILNGATIRCVAPPGSAGIANFRVWVSNSLWTQTTLPYTYYSCSALTTSDPCSACFSQPECGICIPTMSCISSRGSCQNNGFSSSCPVISTISPTSASIIGNSNFTFTIDKNINANYQCVYGNAQNSITSTATPASLVRSNTLTCKPPPVTNWVSARDSNREMQVDLVLRVGSNPAELSRKTNAIFLFDCLTYSQDCAACNSARTQGECSFCFDSQDCRYSSASCVKSGTCPTISSVSPRRIYIAAVIPGLQMSLSGSFSFLNTVSSDIYCGWDASGDQIDATRLPTAASYGPTTITCGIPTIGVGSHTVSLWIRSSFDLTYSRVMSDFSFSVYDCSGTSCTTCVDILRPECVFCSQSASCTHTSTACGNKLTTQSACPAITSATPGSTSLSGNTAVTISGSFDTSIVTSAAVSCLWYHDSTVTPTAPTAIAANEIQCSASGATVGGNGSVAIAVSGTQQWTNSLPFLWYDCATILGDCSQCITALTPKCSWCATSCAETCVDPELTLTTCPSLTSVEPNYGYVLGGENVVITGGPFFSRGNFTYECRFGDKVTPATADTINTLTCLTPATLVTQKVDLTVLLNGVVYTPNSVLPFTYYDCQTFAQTACNSFCMAQPHCGWCVASSTCSSVSRCNGPEDVFLSQCLSVDADPNHMSTTGNQNVTLTFSPRLPDFLLVNSSLVTNLTAIDTPTTDAPVAAKRSLYQTPLDSLVSCQVSGSLPVPAYITDLNRIVCTLPATGFPSRPTLTVLYKNANLFAPIEFSYVDCEQTSNCDDCSRKQFCGWCLQENSCSTLKTCSGDWAEASCPSLISITPESASSNGGDTLTLVGEWFIDHPSIKILMGTDAAEFDYINSTTITVYVLPGTADDTVDLAMMFDNSDYAINKLVFTWVSPFSVPGLAAGMAVAGALLIGGGVFYYLFTRYRKRRQGLFVEVKEPDYEKVAYQNEMVQHFRVTAKDNYNELEDILMNKDRTFLRVLVAITAATEYDSVAKALVYLSHNKGIGADVIQFFASDEVRKSTSENTIFRQNSMASKMFKFYSQIVGTRFLFFTLARVINELNTVAANAQKEKEKLEKMGADTSASLLTIEMEVDPNKLQGTNVDKDQNVYQLALACQKLFTAIVAADANVPAEFRSVFTRIQASITEQYGDSEAIYKALGGFLFLRFVCPAITAPHYYGLLKEPPNPVAQRQLVLIAKVLQNLANLANTKKEAFMESMLDFIERNKPKMITYYKSLLNPESKPNPRMQTNLTVPSAVRENSLAYLHTHIYRNQQKVKQALVELPDQNRAKQLSALVDRIIEKYGEPPKRGKDKGGAPVRSAPSEPIEPSAPKAVTVSNPVANQQASPRSQATATTGNNNANNRPGPAPERRPNQFPTMREPFFLNDDALEGNILEDNVFTDTISITSSNMFDNPFDINFEPMANDLDFEVFDNPEPESTTNLITNQ